MKTVLSGLSRTIDGTRILSILNRRMAAITVLLLLPLFTSNGMKLPRLKAKAFATSYTFTSSLGAPIVACSLSSSAYTFRATIATGSTATVSGEKLRISIPVELFLSTYSAVSNIGATLPTATVSGDQRIYEWNIPAGLTAGQVISFNASLSYNDFAYIDCGNGSFVEQMLDPLGAVASQNTHTIYIQKPNYAISNFTATSPSPGVVSGSVTVTNSPSVTAYGNQAGTVTLFHDSNNNGVIDAGDATVGSQYYYPISETGPITLNYTINTSYQGQLCPLLVRLEVDCACSNPVLYQYNCSVVLPVTLTSFKLQRSEESVQLSWTTTSESNSDRFEIQKSQDGKNWTSIGETKASGTASSLQNYHFADKTLLSGISYYRLKMIDLDQTYAFSKILSFENLTMALVYPNPASDRIKVRDFRNIKSIELINSGGSVVLRKTNPESEQIDLSKLKPGVYVVKTTDRNGSVRTMKIVKE